MREGAGVIGGGALGYLYGLLARKQAEALSESGLSETVADNFEILLPLYVLIGAATGAIAGLGSRFVTAR